ncbi:hypothetical protein [Paenibacillus sp. NPDC093718]|uniref:hypothetical protein n=1 Tax=Paenibacillus sp. NPDC093718 TaxID=3390601 RepID=UPI003D04D7AB
MKQKALKGFIPETAPGINQHHECQYEESYPAIRVVKLLVGSLGQLRGEITRLFRIQSNLPASSLILMPGAIISPFSS